MRLSEWFLRSTNCRWAALAGRGGGLEVGGGGRPAPNSLCERSAGGENECWGLSSGFAVFEMAAPLCVLRNFVVLRMAG